MEFYQRFVKPTKLRDIASQNVILFIVKMFQCGEAFIRSGLLERPHHN